MPELPEVETTRRGIEPWVVGRRVARVIVREPRLRRPVPRQLAAALTGQRIDSVARRAKYLLLGTPAGTAILHLGMSGSLRICRPAPPPGAHDHVDLEFDDGRVLRFTDPRRFGLMIWTREDPLHHPLLARLGPEPRRPTEHPPPVTPNQPKYDPPGLRVQTPQQPIKPGCRPGTTAHGMSCK